MLNKFVILILTLLIISCPVFSQDRVKDILSFIEESDKKDVIDVLNASPARKHNSEIIDPKLTKVERDALAKIQREKENQDQILSSLIESNSSEIFDRDSLSSDKEPNTPLDILANDWTQADTMIALLDLTDEVLNHDESDVNILNKIINSSTGSPTSQMNVLEQIIDLTSRTNQNSQTGTNKSIFNYNYNHNRNLKSGTSNVGILPFIGSEWGRITSGFGYREKYQRMHKGIDIAMSVGDSVRVVMPGVVDRINFERNGYGCYVVVTHEDGYETRYAHLSRCIVNPGDTLCAKQAIALSGNTGNSTGPHLHFEVRQNGLAIDPMSMFDFGNLNVEASLGPALLSENLADPLQYVVESRITTGFNGSKKELTTKRTYIVREGDTLRSIASRAGISVMELRTRNFIADSQDVPVGTMLRLR